MFKTLGDLEAEKLYEILSDIKTETLVDALDDMVAVCITALKRRRRKNKATNSAMCKLRHARQVRRGEGWESWRDTNGSQGFITSRNTGPHASRDKDRDSGETLSNVEAKALVNTLPDAQSKWCLARHLRTH